MDTEISELELSRSKWNPEAMLVEQPAEDTPPIPPVDDAMSSAFDHPSIKTDAEMAEEGLEGLLFFLSLR